MFGWSFAKNNIIFLLNTFVGSHSTMLLSLAAALLALGVFLLRARADEDTQTALILQRRFSLETLKASYLTT
jgi:hypothetical protein